MPLPRSGGSIQPGLNRKAKINSFSVLCCFTAPTGQLRAPRDVPPTCEAAIVLLFAHSDASLVTVCAILCHLIDLSPLGTWEQKKPKKDKVWFRSGALHRQRMQTNTQQLPNAAHTLLHYTIKQQKVIQSPQWQRLKHFHLHNSKFFTQMTKLPHFQQLNKSSLNKPLPWPNPLFGLQEQQSFVQTSLPSWHWCCRCAPHPGTKALQLSPWQEPPWKISPECGDQDTAAAPALHSLLALEINSAEDRRFLMGAVLPLPTLSAGSASL